MSAVAPTAIWSLWSRIFATVKGAQMSGIVGDVNHSFGYHLARRDLPADDYSVVLPRDRKGSDANASAIDVKLPPAQMIVVTKRLLRAAKTKDPRMRNVREFCGTTDGRHTHPYDLHFRQDGPLDSWDDSHLWHIHVSFYRDSADDKDGLLPVADVMAGKPRPGRRVYRVKAGDTLIRIAARWHTTVNRLLRLNPQIKNPNLITPGQKINVKDVKR